MQTDLFPEESLPPVPDSEPTAISKIVRLAWQRAETARQLVYLNCLKIVSRIPGDTREEAAESYLSDVLTAISDVRKDA